MKFATIHLLVPSYRIENFIINGFQKAAIEVKTQQYYTMHATSYSYVLTYIPSKEFNYACNIRACNEPCGRTLLSNQRLQLLKVLGKLGA